MRLNQELNLYAEVNGKVMPVTRSTDDSKFQVSSNQNDINSMNSENVFCQMSCLSFSINNLIPSEKFAQ